MLDLRTPVVDFGRGPMFVALLLAAVSGCGIFESSACHQGILYDVEPQQAILAVGESFTPRATIETCRYGVEEVTLDWISEDPSVASVDAGRITGLREGDTLVRGGNESGAVLVEIAVTVLP